MTSDGTSLGDRMKSYEGSWRQTLPRHAWCVVRVDVRAAHTLLRSAVKPFDPTFTAAMTKVAEALCAEVQGARLAFTQSDEVSVVYRAAGEKAEPWFGGVLAKQVSISAAIATATLAADPGMRGYFPPGAVFDSRAFLLPSVEEVANYLIWRQRDAQRNSVTMVAQSVFSHNALHRKNTGQMVEMLAGRGVVYDDLPAGDRMGRQSLRHTGVRPVEYVDRRTRETVATTAVRSWWMTHPAPQYTADPEDWLREWLDTV